MAAPEDFESWYIREHPRLVTALALVSGNREEAEEAAAEAFARCLERWDTPKAPANPSAWTYTVGVNLMRRRWGRRRREADYTRTLRPPVAPESDVPAVELWRAVAELPPRERIAVVLRYIGGLTEREVAESMKVAPGTVAATLSKARKALARELRALGFDPDAEDAAIAESMSRPASDETAHVADGIDADLAADDRGDPTAAAEGGDHRG